MDLKRNVRLSPDLISQEISDETVLLNLESEDYYGLDPVGTRIWQLIVELGDLQLIYEQLLAEYEVTPEQLATDLEAFLDEAADQGLLHFD